jgi:hypothetical protein
MWREALERGFKVGCGRMRGWGRRLFVGLGDWGMYLFVRGRCYELAKDLRGGVWLGLGGNDGEGVSRGGIEMYNGPFVWIY